MWKLNNSLLKDNHYVRLINTIVNNTFINDSDLSLIDQWELFKIKVREQSILYSKKKARVRYRLKMFLSKKVLVDQSDIFQTRYNELIQEEVGEDIGQMLPKMKDGDWKLSSFDMEDVRL